MISELDVFTLLVLCVFSGQHAITLNSEHVFDVFTLLDLCVLSGPHCMSDLDSRL